MTRKICAYFSQKIYRFFNQQRIICRLNADLIGDPGAGWGEQKGKKYFSIIRIVIF